MVNQGPFLLWKVFSLTELCIFYCFFELNNFFRTESNRMKIYNILIVGHVQMVRLLGTEDRLTYIALAEFLNQIKD